MESFALGGDTNALTVAVPCYSQNRSAYAPIDAGSLVALGLYLHALADSYSHEACMKSSAVRTHSGSGVANECSSVDWHLIQEYGAGQGVEYTHDGAWAVWQALKRYRTAQGYAGRALWTDAEAEQFITSWVGMNLAQDRIDAATAAYDDLNR